jgi:N-acetylmuramoyl-L-alanine amidase
MKRSLLLLLLFLAACAQPRYGQHRYMLPECQQKPVVQRPKVTIVVDAGHGGTDMGTHSTKHNYQEKKLCLATSLWLQEQLERLGYRVIMTRTTDTFIPLARRAQIANEAHAALFLSIHFNSSPNEGAKGIEVFYYPAQAPRDTLRSNQSKSLAQTVLATSLQATKAHSRGIKDANYAVLRQTQMPAILIEGGFLTHQGEKELLLNPDYLKRLAAGVAQGVDEYIQSSQLAKR